MDADDLHALLDGLKRQGQAAGEAMIGRRFIGQRADGALAARAKDDRAAKAVEQRQAVHQLDQGTQQNAASVEEQNAASEQLAERAQMLARLLSRFRTGSVSAREATVTQWRKSA